MLIDIIEKESNFLQTKINDLNEYAHPKLLLSCNKNESGYKWIERSIDGNNSRFLSKANVKQAQELASSTYNHFLLKDCIKEKKALDYYIKNHALPDGQSVAYISNPEVRRLLSLSKQYEREDIEAWATADYNRCTDFPETLTVKSISGRMVRSKSEALIDMALYQNGIPNRYEDTLQINGIILHPDFTIMHPKNGSIFYWEHFGLMDNPKYASNCIGKLQLYANINYYPNINLIITCETSTQPIDMSLVDAIIKHYFL